MDARIADALARLPDYFGNHVLVSVTALALGLGDQPAAGDASLRRPTLRAAVLAATSIVQTIPGLALLALFYPLLLGAGGPVRAHARLRLFRARIPAGGAGAGALQHAAGGAEHHHRHRRHRPGHQAGGTSASA